VESRSAFCSDRDGFRRIAGIHPRAHVVVIALLRGGGAEHDAAVEHFLLRGNGLEEQAVAGNLRHHEVVIGEFSIALATACGSSPEPASPISAKTRPPRSDGIGSGAAAPSTG